MPKSLKYALMVFLGGASYGAMLPLIRMSYNHGFTATSGMLIQNIFSFLILGTLAVIFFRTRLERRQVLILVGIGVVSYVMSFTYFLALLYISATATITLMFQYIWMGILIQAVVDRKPPGALTIVAGIIVLMGTMFTTGILEEEMTLNFPGVFLSLLSALGYALFLFLSGRYATELPTVTRTAIMSVSRLVLALVVAPFFITHMPPIGFGFIYGLLLALGGIVVPVVLIAHAAPHLPSSVTMIMSASELPCAVLLAALLIGEVVTVMTWFGIALILGGILLSQFNDLKKLLRMVKNRGKIQT